MRKIWMIAFVILAMILLITGVTILSNVNTVKDNEVVATYTYSNWIVKLDYNGNGVIYTNAGSNVEKFNWYKESNNILEFRGATNYSAFMQRYLLQNGCLIGEKGDITLIQQ